MKVVAAAGTSAPERQAQFRYAAVFLLVLTVLVFEVVAPDANWARAMSIALLAAALTLAVATSKARAQIRRARTILVAGLALVVVAGIASGAFSAGVAYVVGTVLAVSLPVTLVGGLLRLIRDEGVTVQAVAGALTIYLLVGLLFASAIAFVSAVQSGPFFAQTGHVTNGDRVYYSFAVLTTTGFGDYTAATRVGHALAVLEMLVGQLYLVTVIGILVGSFVGRRR